MSARRTELEVTVRIGEVTVPGGRLNIPATLDFDNAPGGGGGGGGRRPGGSRPGGASPGGGGGGRPRGGSGASETALDEMATAGHAANVAGVFGQFGLRRQLFSLQGLFRTLVMTGPPAAAAVAAVTAATQALEVADTRVLAAVTQYDAALASQAAAQDVVITGIGDQVAALAALGVADEAVEITTVEVQGAIAGQTAALIGLEAAEAGATATTLTFTEALWALLAPLLPIIAAVAAVMLVIAAVGKAFEIFMDLLHRVTAVLVAAFKAMGEAAVWLGERFKEFAEVALQKTIDVLWQFAETVVETTKRGGEEVVKFVEESTGYFVDFEQAIASTVAVMGDFGAQTGEVRKQMSDLANDMSKTSRFSGLDIAKSMQEVAKAGYETVDSINAVTNAGRILAESTLTDIGSSTETLVKVLNQFEMGADQAMWVTNLLAAGANKSLAGIESLTIALQYAGPTAHQYGISLQEVTSALMAMFNQGSRGSMAGTQLTNIFNSLIKQTDKAKAAFAAYGVDLQKLSPTRMGLIEIIRTLEQLQARIGKRNMLELLGKSFELRSIRGFNMLLTVGSAKLTEMMNRITGTNDAVVMQAQQMDTLQGAWLQVTNLWKTAGVALMEGGLGKAFRSVLGLVYKLIDSAKSMGIFKRLGDVFIGLAGIVQSLAEQFEGPLLGAVSAILDMLPNAVKSIGTELAKLVPDVQRFIGALPKIFGDALGKILPAVLRFVVTVVPLLLQFAQMALPLMIDIFSKFVEVVTQFLAENGDKLVGWFEAVLRAVLGLVEMLPQVLPVLGMVVEAFTRLGPQVLQAALEAIPALIAAVQSLVPTLVDLATTGVAILTDMLDLLAGAMQSGIVPVFQAYLGLLLQVGQFIMDNWPMITQIMMQGLSAALSFLNAFGSALVVALGWVAQFLAFIQANWGTIIQSAVNVLLIAIDALRAVGAVMPTVAVEFMGMIFTVEVLVGVLGGLALVIYAVGHAWGTLLTDPINGWGNFAKDVLNVAAALGSAEKGFFEVQKAAWYGSSAAQQLSRSDLPDAAKDALREFGRSQQGGAGGPQPAGPDEDGLGPRTDAGSTNGQQAAAMGSQAGPGGPQPAGPGGDGLGSRIDAGSSNRQQIAITLEMKADMDKPFNEWWSARSSGERVTIYQTGRLNGDAMMPA